MRTVSRLVPAEPQRPRGVEKAAAAVLLRISGVSCNKNGVMNV